MRPKNMPKNKALRWYFGCVTFPWLLNDENKLKRSQVYFFPSQKIKVSKLKCHNASYFQFSGYSQKLRLTFYLELSQCQENKGKSQ